MRGDAPNFGAASRERYFILRSASSDYCILEPDERAGATIGIDHLPGLLPVTVRKAPSPASSSRGRRQTPIPTWPPLRACTNSCHQMNGPRSRRQPSDPFQPPGDLGGRRRATVCPPPRAPGPLRRAGPGEVRRGHRVPPRPPLGCPPGLQPGALRRLHRLGIGRHDRRRRPHGGPAGEPRLPAGHPRAIDCPTAWRASLRATSSRPWGGSTNRRRRCPASSRRRGRSPGSPGSTCACSWPASGTPPVASSWTPWTRACRSGMSTSWSSSPASGRSAGCGRRAGSPSPRSTTARRPPR